MRILVVEDEEKLAVSIKELLEIDKFTVDYVLDGKEGLKRAFAFRDEYALIVLDRLLPGLDGIEICRQLREEKINIPILMLTAINGPESIAEGLNAGADDYLAKPFSIVELSARVNALLRRQPVIGDQKISISGLTIDQGIKEVFVDGLPIFLTLKEYEILELLIRNRGQTISRENIIEKLWRYDSEPIGNVVDTHIKNLRKKIKYDIIKTNRGFGFKVE